MVLLSTSGTKLICQAGRCRASAYAACFRNVLATARYLAGRHERVAVVGAVSRGQFREEDRMCCAWIASRLMDAGYAPEDGQTGKLVDQWADAPPEACAHGESANFLRKTGQEKDLEFILSHVNDLDEVFTLARGKLLAAPSIGGPAVAVGCLP